MGEAKRRKLAGTFPAHGNAEAEIRTITNRRRVAFEAADTGDLDVLRLLVRTRQEANWKHPEYPVVLLDRAVWRDDVEMLRYLLSRGANPNTLIERDRVIPWPSDVGDGLFFSPLATAISEGKAALVKALLSAGADLDMPMVIDAAVGMRQTCRDLLMESPEVIAAMERLELESATGAACRASQAVRI